MVNDTNGMGDEDAVLDGDEARCPEDRDAEAVEATPPHLLDVIRRVLLEGE